jgi:hypothetical protein
MAAGYGRNCEGLRMDPPASFKSKLKLDAQLLDVNLEESRIRKISYAKKIDRMAN